MSEEQTITQEEEQQLREEVAREVWGGETPEEESVTEQPEPTPEADTTPGDQVDPWAGVNPALRQSIESMSARLGDIDTIHNRLKQAESRIGGQERKMYEAQKLVQQVADKPTAEQIQKAKESDDAWQALKEDFPEYFEAVDSVKQEFTKKTAELEGRIPDVAAIQKTLQDDFDAKLENMQKTVEIRLVDRAHKGWRDTVKSPEYKSWLASKPAEYQNVARQSTSADDAISVLDDFIEHRAKSKSASDILADRKKRLNTAAADNRQSGKLIKQKSEEDMTPEEFRKHIFDQEFKKE